MPDTALQPGGGAGVDDAGIHRVAGLELVAPVRGGMTQRREVPLEVHTNHRVPLLLAHVGEHPVAQKSGVVDQNIQTAKGIDGGVDQVLGTVPVGDIITIGDGFATGSLDLLDHFLSGAGASRSIQAHTDVIDDHPGAFGRERQRVRTSDAPACTGNDDDPTVEQTWHVLFLFAVLIAVDIGGVEERGTLPSTVNRKNRTRHVGGQG